MTAARLRRWALWCAGAVACGVLPLALAGAVPWRDVVATRDGADPLLQAAILQQALQHAPWVGHAAFWSPPWFWPVPWAMAFMDPMVGPSLVLRPVQWASGGALVGGAGAAWAYNLVFVGNLAGSFLATAWLTRRLGLGRGTAVLAALVVTLGPWSAGQWHHLNQLPAPWLPLALGALLGLRDAKDVAGATRWALLWVAVFAAQVSWSLYAAAAMGFASVAFVAVCPPRRRSTWWALGGMALLAGAVLAVAALPFREAARTVEGYDRGAEDVLALQARTFDLWKAPRAHLLPWPGYDVSRPVLYVGFVWAVMAGVEVVRRRAERRWLGLAAVGALALLLAMGRQVLVPGLGWEIPSPFAWLQDQLWPLRALRGTSRLSGPFALAVGVLGAAGAYRFWGSGFSLGWRVLVLGVGILECMPGPTPAVRVAPDATEVALLAELRALPEESVWLGWPVPCREFEEGARDARSLLWATWSGRPVAGGASGFLPPPIARLRAACCEELDGACVEALESHGVTHVVWREGARWRCAPVAQAASRLLSAGAGG